MIGKYKPTYTFKKMSDNGSKSNKKKKSTKKGDNIYGDDVDTGVNTSPTNLKVPGGAKAKKQTPKVKESEKKPLIVLKESDSVSFDIDDESPRKQYYQKKKAAHAAA